MPDYRLFGLRLRSPLPFPELDVCGSEGAPDLLLTIRRDEAPELPADGALLGETSTGAGVRVRLFRVKEVLILHYSDTGQFRVTPSTIAWWPGPGASPEASRVDLKGRVLPLALHLRGHLCLHAGAVAMNAMAVALLGPKRVGKSSLTAALVSCGAHFLSDDVLSVQGGSPPLARPGAGAFRLWEDSARNIRLSSRYAAPGLGGKLNVRVGRKEPATKDAWPLGVLYLIAPADPRQEPVPRRLPLPPTPALLALVANVKNGELLGGSDHLKVLERGAELVRAVACYRLVLPRGLERVTDWAREIMAWHAVDALSAPTTQRGS